MANIREIQSRINSVKDTMKITNAMYMISSSKLTQARKKLADTEPYFYALQGEISRILRHLPELHHSYFNKRENIPAEERKIGSIVITADKGLAGAYNHNIVKLEEEILSKPGQHKLFVVGELGRHYFAKKDVDIDTNFRYTVQKPTMHRARDISAVILDQFIVVYTSPAMFFVCVFFANTTGTSKISATTQAIPIPDASIVRILLISSPSKRFLNSLPISRNNFTSI